MTRAFRHSILVLSAAVLLATAALAQRPGKAEEDVPQAPRGPVALVVKARMSAALSLALRLSPEQRRKLDEVLAWQELGAPRSGRSLASAQALLDMLTLPAIESILAFLEPGQTRTFLSLIGARRRAELLELAELRRNAWKSALHKTLKLPPKAPPKRPSKAGKRGGGRRRGRRGAAGQGGGPPGSGGGGRRPGGFAPFG